MRFTYRNDKNLFYVMLIKFFIYIYIYTHKIKGYMKKVTGS